MNARIVLNIAMAAAVLLLPVWSFVVAFLLVLRYRAYEVLVWGMAVDALYSVPGSAIVRIPLFFTALFAVLFIAVQYAKRFLVFYDSGNV